MSDNKTNYPIARAVEAIESEGNRLDLLIGEMRQNPDIDEKAIAKAEASLKLGIRLAIIAVAES